MMNDVVPSSNMLTSPLATVADKAGGGAGLTKQSCRFVFCSSIISANYT